MSHQLKPCPFCGGEAKLDAHWGDCARVEHWCQFEDDAPMAGFVAFEADTADEAVARWNTRHGEEKPDLPLILTRMEAQALSHAADMGTVDEAIDNISFSASEKAAFKRAYGKLNRAIAALRGGD